jgi:putative transposase
MSERHACGLAGIALSSNRYRPRTEERDQMLRARLVELARQNPRYGSPRLCVLMRRETRCNHKRVERIYREAGLNLRRKKRKRLQRQHVPLTTAEAPNQEWALDFVTDALASSRHGRILTVVDVFTRECLALETDTSIGSRTHENDAKRIIRILELGFQVFPDHAPAVGGDVQTLLLELFDLVLCRRDHDRHIRFLKAPIMPRYVHTGVSPRHTTEKDSLDTPLAE